MLVLQRDVGESIMINDDIEIYLISVDENGARIGIRAPTKDRILRKELLEKGPKIRRNKFRT